MKMRKKVKKIEKKSLLLLLCLCMFALLLFGCGSKAGMQDGYYTAEAQTYSHGWKEFVMITVKSGQIVATEYNAKNESGFIKSWDNAYMKNMAAITGTYPNEYTRNYAAQLLETQNPGDVDALTGASSSYSSFQKLAAAAVERAIAGDSTVAIVDTE